MVDGASVVMVTTAVDAEETAQRIAEALVEARLAACVQIMPIRSVYRWQGRIERAGEWLLSIKTLAAASSAVVARITTLHPYEVPEVLIIPVVGGSPAYLRWLEAEVACSTGADVPYSHHESEDA